MEYQDKPAFSSDEEKDKKTNKRRGAKPQAQTATQDKAQPTKYYNQIICYTWF
jgi:hypothetical protein